MSGEMPVHGGGFLPSMQWVPWFRRAEEEGVSGETQGPQAPTEVKEQAMAMDGANLQSKQRTQQRTKLPELHRIEMPRK